MVERHADRRSIRQRHHSSFTATAAGVRPFLLEKSEGSNQPEEEPMKSRNRQPRTRLPAIAAAELAQVTGGAILEYPVVQIVVGLLCLVSASGPVRS
jgi:hypothetical protein